MLGQTPTETRGVTEVTVGGTQLPLVKVHTKLFAKAMPSWSAAPLIIVAVYTVVPTRALDGVKVAVLLDGS